MNLHSTSFYSRLFEEIDISSLVFFRIAFGGILFWEICRYFCFGWIGEYWVEPVFHFTYDGFHWVEAWPENGMSWHFLGLGILALFIMVGLFYRVSAALFFLGFTYVFLLDKANYLNHFYLLSLFSFLMVFVPAHRSFSFDAKFFKKIKKETAPRWALWILAFQISVTCFFAGVAKINADWLAGEPMRMWLRDCSGFPIIGQYFNLEWMPYFFSYGGLLFDLFVTPMLLFRRTRGVAFAAILLFHFCNSMLFEIGLFPWFMVAATGLFFPSSWFRKVVNFMSKNKWPFISKNNFTDLPHAVFFNKKIIAASLLVYVVLQLTIPLRHYFIPGNVSWTEEGHRFSWHMKLRDKQGESRFVVTDSVTGKKWVVEPKDYLTERQAWRMSTCPDMVLQFAHFLKEVYHEKGYPDTEVRAVVIARLNGRKRRYLIDPAIDLGTIKCYAVPAPWIMPLDD